MVAHLSHIPEQSHFVIFSSSTMTSWQVLFWYCVPVSFAGVVVGSLYKMVWSLQIPAGKLSFDSMLWGNIPRSVWYSGLFYTSACGAAEVSGKDFVKC